jgi:hypothetical protein
VPHKTNLWWLTMDCVRLRLLFDCRLVVDVNRPSACRDRPCGLATCSDEFMKQHLSAKSAKVDVVLGMISDMDNAQIAMPLYSFCLSVVLFTSVFRSTPLEQTSSGDVGQAETPWINRLLPSLPPLMTAQLRQAAQPNENGGLGHTGPSDIFMPAYIGSRLNTADVVAAKPGMRDAVAALQDCYDLLAHHVAANQVPASLGATGWDVPTLRTLTRRKTQHTLQSHVHEYRGQSVWPTRHATFANVSVMAFIVETRRVAIMSPGASAFLETHRTCRTRPLWPA